MNPPAKVPKAQASDVSSMEQKLRSTTLSAAAQARQQAASRSQQDASRGKEKGYGQHSPAVAAAAKRQARSKAAMPFELSLDNATLLERRNKKPNPSGLREQMVMDGS